MKINKNTDPQTILDKMRTESNAVSKGIEEGTFSKTEVSKLHDEIDEVILEAYKTKFSLQIGRLAKKQPNLALRDVIVKMLNLLPEDIDETHILILTNYVISQWKLTPQKLAA